MAWTERRDLWAGRYSLDPNFEDSHQTHDVPLVAWETGTADGRAADTCLMIDVEDANREESLNVLYQPLIDFERFQYRQRCWISHVRV